MSRKPKKKRKANRSKRNNTFYHQNYNKPQYSIKVIDDTECINLYCDSKYYRANIESALEEADKQSKNIYLYFDNKVTIMIRYKTKDIILIDNAIQFSVDNNDPTLKLNNGFITLCDLDIIKEESPKEINLIEDCIKKEIKDEIKDVPKEEEKLIVENKDYSNNCPVKKEKQRHLTEFYKDPSSINKELPRIILVDFENVGNVGINGISNLNEKDDLYLFYSKRCSNLQIVNVVDIINYKINFHPININQVCPNALDIVLGTYLGTLVEKHKDTREYFVISNDKIYIEPLRVIKDLYGINIHLIESIIK